MDDKDAVELPRRPRSSTSVDPLTSLSINGITDYASERLTTTALHASCSFHDTDVVIQRGRALSVKPSASTLSASTQTNFTESNAAAQGQGGGVKRDCIRGSRPGDPIIP